MSPSDLLIHPFPIFAAFTPLFPLLKIQSSYLSSYLPQALLLAILLTEKYQPFKLSPTSATTLHENLISHHNFAPAQSFCAGPRMVTSASAADIVQSNGPLTTMMWPSPNVMTPLLLLQLYTVGIGSLEKVLFLYFYLSRAPRF